jgi:hypothetical protein
MKTTAEISDLQTSHAGSRSGSGDSDNEMIRWDDIFPGEIREGDIFSGDTRLGSFSRRRDGQFEAHHANGQLIGIFPNFAMAFSAALALWPLSSAGDQWLVSRRRTSTSDAGEAA